MRYGIVARFFPEKGFGFIEQDSGPDIFFHVSAIGACQETPDIQPGQAVKYELMPRALVRKELEARGQTDTKNQMRAQFVELIDRIPGASLQGKDPSPETRPHPKAKRRKPSWRG